MNPFERLAALRAMAEGLNAAIAKATLEVAEARQTLRIRGVQDTDWGTISQRANPPKIKFNSQLLGWAQQNYPHEVIPEHQETIPASVRPSLYKTLEDRLTVSGDSVVDALTGEVVTFASVEPGKPDSIVFSMSRDQKAEAALLVGARVEAVADALTHELAS